jgi:hypothetical protein
MPTWPQSKARKFRKFFVAVYGRRRLVRRKAGSSASREPAYRRPNLDERLDMWRLAGDRVSARGIGRRLGRDHHTVRRHLQAEWGHDLALSLGVCGRAIDAREMLARLGSTDEFKAEVEWVIDTHRAWSTRERQRFNATASAVLNRRGKSESAETSGDISTGDTGFSACTPALVGLQSRRCQHGSRN